MTEQDYRTLLGISFKAMDENQRKEFKNFLESHRESLVQLSIEQKIQMVQGFVKGMLNIVV